MVPTYNGWQDGPEDEREALEQWEARRLLGRRSSRGIPCPDISTGTLFHRVSYVLQGDS
jgi:hypothetical protein